RSLPPDIDVGERQDHEEEAELEEPEPRELVEDDSERVEEDDLDVEDDEEHRGQVEADREALRLRRPLRDARLEGEHACARAPRRPLRERERHHDHRRRDREAEEAVDQKGKPVAEHVRCSPTLDRRGRIERQVIRTAYLTNRPRNGSTIGETAVTNSPSFHCRRGWYDEFVEIAERPQEAFTLLSLTPSAAAKIKQ